MSTASDSLTPLPSGPLAGVPTVPASAERWMTELHALLRELEAVTAASHTLPPVFSEAVDDQLVQVRLGVAASLFAALQCKNAAIGRTRLAGGADLLGLGDEAGTARGRARRHRSRRPAARRRHDRRAGPHLAEAGVAGRRRSGRDGPRPQDEPGNPPPQLHLAAGSGDRRARVGLVRRQPARICRCAAGRFRWARG